MLWLTHGCVNLNQPHLAGLDTDVIGVVEAVIIVVVVVLCVMPVILVIVVA